MIGEDASPALPAPLPPAARDESAEELLSPEEAEAILQRLADAFLIFNQAFSEYPAIPLDAEPVDSTRDRELPEPTDASEGDDEDALLVVDDSGIVQSTGGTIARMFGVAGRALVGGPLATLFAGAPPKKSGRVRLRRADGTEHEAFVTVAPLPELRARAFVLRDGGAERREQAASKRAQARFQTLVEQIPAVTFMASLEGADNEIYIGPQIESLLGYSQKEWLESPVLWFHRMHPDDQERWNAEFARGCAEGGPFRADCRFFARDGRTVWVHGEARVVRDRQGRPLFIQGVAFDITDSKVSEEGLRKAREALARSEKLAAIGGLAASVGHELRNPLAAIRNAWFYLNRRVFQTPEAQSDLRLQEFSRVVSHEIDRCAKIVGDLLDFSRVRPLHRVPTPARELVQSALDVVVKPATSIELLNLVSAELPVPNLDSDQFRQVLVNLLQNGAEAVDPQQGRIEVRAAEQAGKLVLLVVDNGRGMPEDVQARIFEPLYTTKLRGTGLGLAIVEGIVKRHGGSISVTSAVNRGTTFAITIPIGEASTQPQPDLGGAADLRAAR